MTLALVVALLTSPEPHVVQARVTTSIEASLAALSPHGASVLAAQVARLLRWKGDIVRNVQRGDLVTALYEGEAEPELVALDYQGAELTLRAYRFQGADGVPRYFDEGGRLVEPVLERSPLVSYVQITETVQHGRGKRKHEGLDFKAPEGTPITLPFPGRVARVNWSRRVNGNCVEIDLGEGRAARFLHLATIDAGVVEGAPLAAGVAVGTVGSTGRSSAPHLHYELRDADGKALDPLAIHGTREGMVGEAERASFDALRTIYERMLVTGRPGATRL